MKKFTLVDYIIIILVICAVIFAFIHITSDDSSTIQKTAFDASTLNKIPDTYSNYYKDGYIVKATVNGYNASNGEDLTIDGDVIWSDNNGGSDIKLLIKSDNTTFLAAPYRYCQNADIYIDSVSLESNGEKYDNLYEITVKPQNISSLNELVSSMPEDCNYEITTKIAVDSFSSSQLQEINNKIANNNKQFSIKTTNEADNLLLITQANSQNIKDANSVLGKIDGVSSEITIRIYNCSENQLDSITDNMDVLNIRDF